MDALDALEGIYQAAVRPPATSTGGWLAAVFEALRPMLDLGLGALAYEFDLRTPGFWITPADAMIGDPMLASATRTCFDAAGVDLRTTIYGSGPVILLNTVLGMPVRDHPITAGFVHAIGCADYLGIQATDADGRGVMLSAPVPEGRVITAVERRQWRLIAAHLVGASRLHRALTTTGLVEAGIVSDRGRAEPARADVPLEPLRDSAAALRRARSERDRTRALPLWQVLASARWSLVANVASGSQRTYVAYENVPTAPDPRALTPRERVIAQLVAFGQSNKLIAYQLGVSEGTVSTHVASIRHKLRTRSRAELVRIVAQLASAPAETVEVAGTRVAVACTSDVRDVGDPRLSAAEREVARLAASGLSNAEIARARGASPRTIANQLASIYGKLGVDSRAQLALRAT